MSFEGGFEQNNSLSAEQQKRLAGLSDTIKPSIEKLDETKLQSDADDIMEQIKAELKERGVDMSNEQLQDFIKGLSNPQG